MRKIFFIITFCLGICLLIFIDQWQVVRFHSEKSNELNAKVELYSMRLANAIRSRFYAVESLASLFILHPETNSDEFAHFASHLLKFNPPIRAMQYANSNTRVTYVFPFKGNEVAIEQPMTLLADPKRGPYTKKAIQQKTAILQGPFELRQGGQGIVLRFPIFNNGEFLGLSIGVYDIPVIIEEALGKQEPLVISIKDFKGNIFWKSGDVHGNFKEKTFSAADTTWTITASWGAQLHPPYFQRLLIWFFGIGFLLTSLYTIRLFGKQTRYLEALIQRRTAELSIANEQLQVSEERQRKRIENSSAGYFFINSEGNYEYVNTAWLRMHKYDTAGEVIGKHYSLTQTDTDLKNAHKTVENLLDKESIITGEFSRLCKDKSIGYHTFTALPVKDKEKIIGLEGFLIDITEQKLLAEQLRQARKMESIGTMAGGIAHDFNNILFMISGNAELAMEDIPKWNGIYSHLEEIKSASLRAAAIVKQLLDFSRPTDKILKPIGAVSVIKNFLKFLRSTLPDSIQIRHLLPEKEVTILGDPIQINQLLMNLCNNAYQIMEQTGGVLEIRVDVTPLETHTINAPSGLSEGDYLKISVNDTGAGISPEIIDRIFDPYFTTKNFGESSGMGLTVVHGIVKKHNGFITVNSQPGKGTNFAVYFPLLPKETV